MAEFLEVPLQKEDGAVGVQYINLDAISYVEVATNPAQKTSDDVKVHLNNGYWFTLSGSKAEDVLTVIKERACIRFTRSQGDN